MLAIIPSGCASKRNQPERDTRDSWLSSLPFVYKMTVQQGNLVTDEMVDQLELGMTQAQVRYLLGTPLMTHIFHQDRWDYPFTIRRGHRPREARRLTLWFEQDTLVQIQGDFQPNPARLAAAQDEREIIVEVPDWQDNRGLVNRLLNTVGIETRN